MNTITVMLADDQRIVRQGISALLAQQPGFAVIGEAADGPEAVELCERLQPDILILDLMMPAWSGLEVLRRLRQRAPRVRILVLTTCADEVSVIQALHDGADGYVLKDVSLHTLVKAMRIVMTGGRYLCPHLLKRLPMRGARQTPAPVDPYETLTPRERQVLKLAAEGNTSAQTAQKLFISRRTAETHRARGMQKLHLKTQTDLIRFAMRRGILDSDL